MTDPENRVAICVVSHDSAADLSGCLSAIIKLTHRPLEVTVVDCASTDESPRIARQAAVGTIPMRVINLQENLGFAGGMNRAIRATNSPFVLLLNPDSRPEPEYLSQLLRRLHRHPDLRVGAVTGRLERLSGADHGSRLLDACGVRLTFTWRHLDRGSGQREVGQWMQAERVFGATGAATLYARAALDDVAFGDAIFAPEFHLYREDAELCFRLRERGWEVLYEPTARCEHRRRNLPSRRSTMPPEINYHSLKNRYLLRAYHQDGLNFLLTLLPTAWRDLLALVYVLIREPSSLPAYGWLWKNRRQIMERRRWLMHRRTCSSWEINRWFLHQGLPL